MIPDCDGRSDGQTVRQTESIIANTALCIARAMLTRCKNWMGRYWVELQVAGRRAVG